jgi:hypothetical protein
MIPCPVIHPSTRIGSAQIARRAAPVTCRSSVCRPVGMPSRFIRR